MPARSLRKGLDNEVYQVALRLLEDPSVQPDTRSLYQALQKSNSSLKRKPKRLIEDSLDRVLEALDDRDNEEDDEEAQVDQRQNQESKDLNLMNKSITTSWSLAPPKDPNNAKMSATAPELSRRSETANGEPPKKRRKQDVDRSPPSDISLSGLGGVDDVIEQLEDILVLPLTEPETYAALSLPLPRGVLLHGPPGCGKSMIARAYAAELGVPFVEILGPSIVSGMSGESEKQVRELFDEAKRLAPCLIFIDEIDVIAPKRESSQSQMEKRIVAQLLISMDSLATDSKSSDKPVIVLAATNRPDSLDPALRRGGRFDTEISMGVPNEPMRESILRAQTKHTSLADDIDFARLAKMTPGFVGADLRDLVGKAGAYTMKQYTAALKHQALTGMDNGADIEQGNATEKIHSLRLLISRCRNKDMPKPPGFENMTISMAAFLTVLPKITPSSKREGFATVPDTTWEDIGALKEVREHLQRMIVDQVRHPDRFAGFQLGKPAGILLWGPPGCGKTLLAKAVAAESKANFISVKGPELLNKYVGESERAVRTLFMRARSSVPCVIFFDELDALTPRRDDSASEASARVVNTLLTELDGLSADRDGIYVIAATNRPDIIDGAMLRPGRLGRLLFVGLPGPDERVEICRALLRSLPRNIWPEGVAEFARVCDGFSGADLESLVNEAGQMAINRGAERVGMEDFEAARAEVRPSVRNIEQYEKLKKTLGKTL